VAHRAAARQPGLRRCRIRARDGPGRSRPQHVAVVRSTEDIAAQFIATGARPRIAILREQGVNSQTEMAYAFYRAGFAAVDVHMTDLIDGRQSLADFKGLVACGGFSYGDVLGAGGGWAKTILHNPRLAEMFISFFNRTDSFALGVCNGCQMMSHLRSVIPERRIGRASNATHRSSSKADWCRWRSLSRRRSSLPAWPEVVRRLPTRMAKAVQYSPPTSSAARPRGDALCRFAGAGDERYPYNPNGSAAGITGLTTADGRFTIVMPHPERVFRTVQMSWQPPGLGEDSPWMRMFRNARRWVG